MPATASNCPNCEFARRGAGAPVELGGGLWRCESCGNRWREIASAPGGPIAHEVLPDGMPPESSAQAGEAPVVMSAAERAGEAADDAQPAEFSDTLALLRRRGRPSGEASTSIYGAAAGTAFGVAAVLAGWFGMATLVSHWPVSNWPGAHWALAQTGLRADALELSVAGADRLSDAGRSAVQVRGSITNRSGEQRMLEPIEIVLTDAEGGAMGSWRFRPAVAYIEAGQTIHFTSAKGNVPALALGVEIRFASTTRKIALGMSSDAHRPQQEDRGAVQRRGNRPQES